MLTAIRVPWAIVAGSLFESVLHPLWGGVCMNILMVDVTDIPDVSIGDEVVLIGRQGDEEIQVEELASLSDTINYEFLARLSPAISRSIV